MNLSDKEKLINAVCLHYVILCSFAELEPLKRGLQVYNLMEQYPDLLKPYFLHHEKPLTSGYFQTFFMSHYARERQTEEALMMNWEYYLKDLESKFTCRALGYG